MTEEMPKRPIFDIPGDSMPRGSEKIPSDPVDIAKHLIDEFSDRFDEPTLQRPLDAMRATDIEGLEKILSASGK
ncbi:hypothetical protein A3C21_01220 [Candidatus Kaiserbacteria bacterium RIFCSPHIGHO2_02_FULL_59_21]|uniref:Uncharacterized protein n=2 Tax=Candidatus Kaiseribacteriota TaxID=1752734 RepID=A0A0G1YV44_9BACT|nr:MAG: hypothetical protein UY98_C0023G0005 [Candidatus Kaiserbacteria bacterium GW2011_GWA2_58_9]OGG63054.1 MAG: hypothetical protein A2766_01950 [Candidatus Kaiserbacteria bacterium RIFCSPHIGHO2_01_FULL_58_22]OGG67417.1 MAG: hypothetical protein A3C21_01220 [Candidatus Kaiserbacteria bacterium RIFCSPHIGHO2_02_FULL_59_21]OGG80266.1 MAG: hypothetical protein A2952_01855 [Candidatus Kaiserbacteria bacterium RIFCSPLOWO2_01_FULL_59_34]OGG85793.1 MAG: hypothetical protein A3I47_00135 [Candidatus K